MSDSVSDLSVGDLDQEIQELFGLNSHDVYEDKRLVDNSLFPELRDLKEASRKCDTNELTKGTRVIRMKVVGNDFENDLTGYLDGTLLSNAGKNEVHLLSTAGKNEEARVGKWVNNEIDENDYDRNNLSMSKNAVSARENRLKKKAYVQHLEKSVKDFSAENYALKTEASEMNETIESLKTEVKYLKSVLSNQGTLGALLKNILDTKGVGFQSSESRVLSASSSPCKVVGKGGVSRSGTKRRQETGVCQKENRSSNNSLLQKAGQPMKREKLDHDYATNETKCAVPCGYEAGGDSDSEDEESVAGVCLHVSNKKVSFEFCATCSEKASGNPGRMSKEKKIKDSHSRR